MISFAWRYKTLIWQLLRRDIHSRYRGSALGLLWSLATPILLLLIYTFVFQYIFKARWNDTSGETTSSFAMILFLGLSLHSILSEVVTKSSQLITTNPNFVKKIVFPLEILPWVNLLGALFNFSICLLLLLIVMFFKMGSIPLTALLLPVILLPYLIMLMGIGCVCKRYSTSNWHTFDLIVVSKSCILFCVQFVGGFKNINFSQSTDVCCRNIPKNVLL
jgi:lipopolysaccharide transport system permease protein